MTTMGKAAKVFIKCVVWAGVTEEVLKYRLLLRAILYIIWCSKLDIAWLEIDITGLSFFSLQRDQ